MMVCAHGNVDEFCKERDMIICARWDGSLRDYKGVCRVVVTDSDISETEYYFLKSELLVKGIELVSTRYKDGGDVFDYIVYANSQRKKHSGGRPRFSNRDVIDRIVELRTEGKTLRAIREDERVRNSDGSKICLSTILDIIEREKKR